MFSLYYIQALILSPINLILIFNMVSEYKLKTKLVFKDFVVNLKQKLAFYETSLSSSITSYFFFSWIIYNEHF